MIISFQFFGILILSAFIYWLLPRQDLRTIFLIIASLGFIGIYDKFAVLVIILLTIYAYGFAYLIEKQNNKKLFHRLSIIGLVFVLGIFKYLGFLANTISSMTSFIAGLPVFHFEKLLLPLGISYIVFKYISYLTDIYWGIVKKGNFIGYISADTFSKINLRSSQKVGPTISDKLTKDAILAVFFSLVLIFLYILVRFDSWQYGLGGVVSLAHDAIITMGAFSLLYGFLPFSLEIDQSFIAAVLTVIGYSINDTVIIYDRIREYRHLYPKRGLAETMDHAMNATLRRTFSTSLTVLIVLFAIFLFGGASIKGFTFALLIGIGIGTYSSVFNAAPIVYDTITQSKKFKKNKQLV